MRRDPTVTSKNSQNHELYEFYVELFLCIYLKNIAIHLYIIFVSQSLPFYFLTHHYLSASNRSPTKSSCHGVFGRDAVNGPRASSASWLSWCSPRPGWPSSHRHEDLARTRHRCNDRRRRRWRRWLYGRLRWSGKIFVVHFLCSNLQNFGMMCVYFVNEMMFPMRKGPHSFCFGGCGGLNALSPDKNLRETFEGSIWCEINVFSWIHGTPRGIFCWDELIKNTPKKCKDLRFLKQETAG